MCNNIIINNCSSNSNSNINTNTNVNNTCSNCKFWNKDADPCEWWTGKYNTEGWENAKFCSKSDFDYKDEDDTKITAYAISGEGYTAGLMTKSNHSCSMFEERLNNYPIDSTVARPPSST